MPTSGRASCARASVCACEPLHLSSGGKALRWRDLKAGELRKEHVGQRLALAGWAARRRDHGGLVFIDLRDEAGPAQLVINPDRAPEAAAPAHGVRDEFVLRAEGEGVAR